MTSLILITRNSTWPLPALRWVIVASLMCSPTAHARSRLGDALSMPCVKTMSWKVALPAPPPAPVIDWELLTPQENDRTSISPLCLSSADSPLMSPILAKMSAAIACTDPLRDRTDERARSRGGDRLRVNDGSRPGRCGTKVCASCRLIIPDIAVAAARDTAVTPGRRAAAGPESMHIAICCRYGFRARAFGTPRNDD